MKLALFCSFACTASAFAPTAFRAPKMTRVLRMSENEGPEMMNRREAFGAAALVGSTLGLSNLVIPTEPAMAAGGPGSDPDHPIVVIGAGGKCGALCTDILNKKNLYTRAVTRSGREILPSPSSYVSYAAGDVTNLSAMSEAVKGASGVIFAASASGKKKGGDPAHVDYLGVYNTAKACLEAGVPKLVVISAAEATRPDAAGYKATNFFVKYVYGDGIMDHKIAGEQIMRDLYADSKGPAYTVVRPGGLSDKPSNGPGVIHVSQGDVYASEIPREDVAQVSVAAILAGSKTDFCTFELNQVEGLGKSLSDLPDLDAKLVHAGSSSYEGLLDGLLTDQEMKKSYPELMNDFRGNGVLPIDQIA